VLQALFREMHNFQDRVRCHPVHFAPENWSRDPEDGLVMAVKSGSLSPASRLALFAVFVLFFFTGAAGLIYQVSWQRWLLNVFGATIYSVATVLAAFMGGLALGSYLFAGPAQRMRRPLAAYGLAEIGIGISALILPLMLRLFDPVFSFAYQSLDANFAALTAIRFFLVFMLLLIPTTLMGATIPLLARFLSPDGTGAGGRVGFLYALNTLGAVVGTVLAGFVFIRFLGVQGTVALAVAINVIAGGLSIWLAKFFPELEPQAPKVAPEAPSLPASTGGVSPSTKLALIFGAYAISGFCALALEVAWSRALIFTFDALKSTTYSFTAMLATYLVGVALGSAVLSPFVHKAKNPFRLYALLLCLIGISSILSLFVLYHRGYEIGSNLFQALDESSSSGIRWSAAVALVFVRAGAVMFLPTFCMGLAFPVAVRIVTELSNQSAQVVGRLYAINTVGAIFGSIVAGFFLVPFAGLATSIIMLGSIQVLAGVWLLLKDEETPIPQRRWLAGLGVAVVLVAFVRQPRPAIFQLLTPTEREIVFYKEGPLATVSVIENDLGFRTIYVDAVGVAGTDPILLTDQKSLAHVPMLLLENPKSAVTVGFGSGGASFSYTLYPELEEIHCLEITRTVVDAAPTLKESNHGVVDRLSREQMARATPVRGDDGRVERIRVAQADGSATEHLSLWGRWPDPWIKSDSRFEILLDDARSFLKHSGRKYDIIATDCTDLRYKSNANLYDVEYFTICRERITDEGMVVVWMPLAGLSDESYRVALRSFEKVFPHMEVLYPTNHPTHYVLLLGTKEPLKIDVDVMRQRLANPLVRKDLEEIGFSSVEKILSCFILGGENLRKYIGDGPLNTENTPFLEFESPLYGYGDSPLLNNVDNMMRFHTDPLRLVSDPSQREAVREVTGRFVQALPDVILGHRLYRELDLIGATQAYMRAQAVNPEDPSLPILLNMDELRRKITGQPNQIWPRWKLGESLAIQGRDSEAVTVLNEALRIPMGVGADGTVPPQLLEMRQKAGETLAQLFERNNQPERAARVRQQIQP
jgi:spermidine synthase